jgi:phosphoribosylamine--glycine ligase
MKVLVIGSGGREHALCWRLAQSPDVEKIWCAPGNPGTSECATNVTIRADDISALADFASQFGIDLTVVGPEAPLVAGIVDLFRRRGLRIFGPTASAARLESSKAFAKEAMTQAGIPTAAYRHFDNRVAAEHYCAEVGVPVVLKADGLAAGKGVVVCRTAEEVRQGMVHIWETLKSETMLVEQFLHGPEVSFFVATDGEQVIPLGSAHDYKRVGDGNTGPNTGGMGALSPTPYLSERDEAAVVETIVQPLLATMRRQGTPFCGFLYVGLILPEGKPPHVIEFNARFGDPECQVMMRRLQGDLFSLLYDLADNAPARPLSLSPRTALAVVHASAGYPESSRNGDPIQGLQRAEQVKGVVVFHAGTAIDRVGHVATNGGRVLAVTAEGSSLEEARERAYEACEKISFPGRVMRTDIGGPNFL